MPRPLSWLPRLHSIRSFVANSVRSHYDRADLERLFELQPRAAQKLLEILPTIPVGTAKLVDREVLLGFLDRVRDADDTAALFTQIRHEKAQVLRRKPRSLVRTDVEPVTLASLPESIGLSRGRLEISFRDIEQLAEALYALGRVLAAEGDAFALAFEPQPPAPPEPKDAHEMEQLFAELEAMEAEAARIGASTSHKPNARSPKHEEEEVSPLSSGLPAKEPASPFPHPLCGDTPQRPGHRASHPPGQHGSPQNKPPRWTRSKV